jgi:hypothetical protein
MVFAGFDRKNRKGYVVEGVFRTLDVQAAVIKNRAEGNS